MKRKRDTNVSDSPAAIEARPKRRRNDTTVLDTIQFIFDCLRNERKRDDDIYLCEAFLRVPRKKAEPQYYDVVQQPLDMLTIQQKIKTDQYNDLESFCADISLIVDNAKLYYAKSTDEYRDACQLWTLFEESRKKAPDEVKKKQEQKLQHQDDEEKYTGKKRGSTCRGTVSSVNKCVYTQLISEEGPPMTQREAAQELFGAIVTARDTDDRLLSYVFRILPSKERYPEYYTIIKKPIDLRIMAGKLCDRKYPDLDSLTADFDLLFNNACEFNEPGSCIYRDANKLRRLVHARKQELLEVVTAGKGRLRCRKPADVGGEWHEFMRNMDETTALPLAEEDPTQNAEEAPSTSSLQDEDDSDEDVNHDNPLWQVFLQVKTLTMPSNPNYHLIEPFRRLPNRRWHADYYQSIEQPISMSQIRNKIKRSEYVSLSDLQQDFDLMFNNAQQYNIPDSRIYKDSVNLQASVSAHIKKLIDADPTLSHSLPLAKTMTTPSKGKTASLSGASTPVSLVAPVSGGGASADSDSEGEDSRQSTVSGTRKRGVHATPGGANQLTFKRRAKLLFKTLMDFMTEDGRQPIVAFIEKPSKREYPDYYQVIETPIDMETIEMRIKTDYYSDEAALLADFRLMFNNCLEYNEEGSVIHNDAQTLLKVLNDKVQELNQGPPAGHDPQPSGTLGAGTPAAQLSTPVAGASTGTPTVAQPTKVLQLKKAKQQPPQGTLRNVKYVYNAVVDFKDSDGRQLSEVFVKLPSKILYPDYYELIKHPIDLERVLYKWKIGTYTSVDDFMADLTLLFNNACRYNEPESQIYRDALTLQQIALQKRLELVWQDSKVPRVRTLLQELLMSLFITVFNHEEEDRYTAESFADLPSQDPEISSRPLETQIGTIKNRPLTFDILKRRLDKGLYTRLDHFQEDLFSIFNRARRLSAISSRVYKDALTLQTAYITARDKLCGSGRILKSQALKFTKEDLNNEIKADKESRKDEEESSTEMDEDGGKAPKSVAPEEDTDDEKKDLTCVSGDFIYVVPVEAGLPKRIVHVQRVFRDNSSNKNKNGRNAQLMVSGVQYYRPEDTFHPATKKFYPKEVFKSEKHLTFPMSDMLGHCLILFINDYPKMTSESFLEEDIYVCESRYMARHRFFKKIKVVPFNLPKGVTLKERGTPMPMTRIDSIFKERIERHKEELAEVDEETRLPRQPLPNVARSSATGTGELEFEQYNLGSGAVVKLGDFVYVKAPPLAVSGVSCPTSSVKVIRHVTRIWLNPQGVCMFAGSVYSTAQELYMSGVQLERMVAYKQEVYLTSVQDSLPLTDIVGRCSVLHVKEYAACRLTEIPEKDVYMCQNFYDENLRRISPLQSGIIKFTLSRQVLLDEIYYFSNAVNLQKSVLETINLAQLPRKHGFSQFGSGMLALDDDLAGDLAGGEDSMDSSAAPSHSSDSTPPALAGTPAGAGGKRKKGKALSLQGRKQVSGYLLFSSEIRKSITMRNPTANFGEISRLVGMEWKRLSENERTAFEDRAHVMNQEMAEKALLGDGSPTTLAGLPAALEMPLPTSPDVIYECMWGDCDVMFEDLADMFEHLLNEQTGHLYKSSKSYSPSSASFECQWRGCSRQKKNNLLPFPLMTRLIRHVKEVHLIKNCGRTVLPHDRNRNLVPSCRRSMIAGPPVPAAGPTVMSDNTDRAQSDAATLPGFTLGKAGFQVSVMASSTAGSSNIPPPPATGLAGLLQPQRVVYPPPFSMFFTPPSKTQRLLHSEAYIKYIENLDKPYQSNWERQLHAGPENIITNSETMRMPANWLPCREYGFEAKPEDKKDVLQGLWALRQLMMKDALCGSM